MEKAVVLSRGTPLHSADARLIFTGQKQGREGALLRATGGRDGQDLIDLTQ